MKKLLLYGLCASILLVGASGAGSARTDRTQGGGATITYDQAAFLAFMEAMQTIGFSSTGVVDPFSATEKDTLGKKFNSYAFSVLDATRPGWNRSIQLSELVTNPYLPAYYEFLVDINESAGNLDLNRFIDGQVKYNYNSGRGNGRNIDPAFMLPTSLFSGHSLKDVAHLNTQFARLDRLDFPSQAGFEAYAPREEGIPVPEAATMLLLGCGLIAVAGLGGKRLFK